MKLYAFGCSLTYGQTLEDCTGKTTMMPGPEPSKFAWPQILADKLGVDCYNLSMPGSSNKLILDKILKCNIEHQDVVIVQWSYLARWCWFEGRGNRQDLGPWKHSHPFYNFVWNEYDCLWSNIILMDYAWLHLEKIKCKFLFCHIEKGQRSVWQIDDLDYLFDEKKFKYSKFEYESIKDFSIDTALDDHHPGPKSHKSFANYLYNLPIFSQLTNTK